MRHVRSFAALLTIAAITAACTPGSTGGESQGGEASQGGGASQPAASTGGGGGGGGGGANGSVTYEITGDYEASGELPFLAGGLSLWIESAGGWVANFANPDGGGAVILVNTQEAEGTPGQIFSFGDGTIIIGATSDPGSGMNCDWTLEKNDADGLKGHVECPDAFGIDNTSGARYDIQLSAEWDAHP